MLTMHKLRPVVVPVIVALIITTGLGFFGGMKYGASRAIASVDSRGFGSGGIAARRDYGGRMQGNFTVGDIVAKDDKSITVSIRGGGSKIVFFSDATQIMKSAAGALSDLQVGEQVTAMGTQNSDGSITAQSIQIRPPMSAGSPGRQ